MAKNFAEIAFTNAVKQLQEKHGSRKSYERMEKFSVTDGLTNSEMTFIEQRDSFYLSTIGVNEFPYIQHRGGPKGFLKVIDSNRLGFVDFIGNKQYVSVGNMATNNKVSLIMVDYPSRTRLKIFAKSEIIELKDNPTLYKSLDLEGYKFRPDRMMIFHIEAYDWNCPQHITPRYTVKEIEEAFLPQLKYIAKLEEQIKGLRNLKQKINKNHNSNLKS
jgi:predicted pyridoxine 5'-phosphate oxidase superfamily flavin-nucleotide-binding protein